MKRIALLMTALVVCVSAFADGRPVSIDRVPTAARNFISANFPSDNIAYATVDDDLIYPDYTVMLESGMKLEFTSGGALDKIEAGRAGIPVSVIPVQIVEYVERHYPGASYSSYDVGRRSYEVELSNGMELKFNSNFALVEVDF